MLAKQAAHTLCVTGIGGVPTPHVLSYFFKSRWNAAKWPWLLRQQQGFNWSPRNRHLCEPIRGLQNLESSRKGTGLFFSLLRKEPKVAQRVAPLWTLGTVQNSTEKYFLWHFQLSSLNRYIVRPAFSDVLNRCERVIVHQTQDRCFSKMGYCTASSQGRMYSKRAAARYLCCGGNLFLRYAD